MENSEERKGEATEKIGINKGLRRTVARKKKDGS